MATAGQWVQGARPRTLPAAIAPVLVGTAIAWSHLAPILRLRLDGPGWFAYSPGDHIVSAFKSVHDDAAITGKDFITRAMLALVVALALQIGVNYANDYSDGIRGTDEIRVGPVRLVGQQLASRKAVKRAAFGSFIVAAIAGLSLVLITQTWWLLLVGAAAILAAWFYTGGPRPYGYAGLGELFVFVFFGLVAVTGTTYVQTIMASWQAVVSGVAIGALSVAILLANNLRDIPSDAVSGKRTLAVRMGDGSTRAAYSLAIATPYVASAGIAIGGINWALLAFVSLPLAIKPTRIVRSGAIGRDLIPVLAGTGLLLLGYAIALSAGFVISVR